jgi:hypothetical protein
MFKEFVQVIDSNSPQGWLTAVAAFVGLFITLTIVRRVLVRRLAHEGTAHWIKQLINEAASSRRLGEKGREHIENSFLRHNPRCQLREYQIIDFGLDSQFCTRIEY